MHIGVSGLLSFAKSGVTQFFFLFISRPKGGHNFFFGTERGHLFLFGMTFFLKLLTNNEWPLDWCRYNLYIVLGQTVAILCSSASLATCPHSRGNFKYIGKYRDFLRVFGFYESFFFAKISLGPPSFLIKKSVCPPKDGAMK